MSITDACIHWSDTVTTLKVLSDGVEARLFVRPEVVLFFEIHDQRNAASFGELAIAALEAGGSVRSVTPQRRSLEAIFVEEAQRA